MTPGKSLPGSSPTWEPTKATTSLFIWNPSNGTDTKSLNHLQQLENQLSNQKKKSESPLDPEVQQELAEEQFGSEAAIHELDESAMADLADAAAIKWLEENCSIFHIGRNRDSGKYNITGTLDSKEAGYVESYVVRDQRKKGVTGPFYIHEEDIVREYRKVEIGYRGAESLGRAVETIIITYAPGDVAIHSNEFCDYHRDNRALVRRSGLPLAQFKEFDKVDLDLSDLIPIIE